jgi:hypothetical protein
VKVSAFVRKLEALKTQKQVAGSTIKVEEDLYLEVTNTRNRLIPYLMDAKGRGHIAVLNKGIFVINVTAAPTYI